MCNAAKGLCVCGLQDMRHTEYVCAECGFIWNLSGATSNISSTMEWTHIPEMPPLTAPIIYGETVAAQRTIASGG